MDTGSASTKYFGKAQSLVDAGNYEYAIEMFLLGLARDPENVEAHQALRDACITGSKSKAIKPIGMLAAMKMKKPLDDLQQNVTNAEKLLSHDPKNLSHMELFLRAAATAGHRDTVLWIGPVLERARQKEGKQNADHFIVIKDMYKKVKAFDQAADTLQIALALRPDSLELRDELNRITTEQAIQKGNYSRKNSFTISMKSPAEQSEQHRAAADLSDKEQLAIRIEELRQKYREDPDDDNRLVKLIDLLLRAGDLKYENEAISVLEAAYGRLDLYRYKHQAEQIQIKQLKRFERLLKTGADAEPDNEQAQKEYQDQVAERQRVEREHLQGSIKAYPTDMKLRMEAGELLFEMGHFDEAIPMLQQAQTDGNFKQRARLLLGRSFLEAEFVEEAVATLESLRDDYGPKGDDRAKEIFYWLGRSMEENQQTEDAVKSYSQIAQWDFGYEDVQTRIKELRAKLKAAS